MATEAEILYNFLLERSDISQIITVEQLKRLFPARASEKSINALHKLLNKKNSHRIQRIEDAINERETTLSKSKELELSSFKEKYDSSFIMTINGKLSTISTLVDSELRSLESEYYRELQKLKELNDDLSGIPYAKRTEGSLDHESMESLLKSLQELEELCKEENWKESTITE